MVQLIAGKPRILRDINEINILHLIREEGPISRIDISKRIGISQTAVSRIVARLIKNNYIVQNNGSADKRSVGRQPILLKFNHGVGYIVAIDIGRANITYAILNLGGKIIKKRFMKSQFENGRDEVLNRLSSKVLLLIDSLGINLSQVYGIGITIPGLVKVPLGIIRTFGRWKEWYDFNLRHYFEKKFGIPTHVESDARAIALGEYFIGFGKTSNNLVCLCVTEVGPYAGIIYNGQLIRGVSDSAGEVGTTQVGYYIRDGYLFKSLFKDNENILFDQVIQPKALLDIVKKELQNGRIIQTSSKKLAPDTITLLDIVRAAEAGDEFCEKLLKEFAVIMGALCINIINLFNPEMIILNGEVFWEGSLILETVKETIKKHILPISVEPVQIVVSKLKENRYILGVASLVLSNLFSPPTLEKEKLLFFDKMKLYQ